MLRRNGPVVKSVESVLTLVTVSDSAKNRTFRSSLTACGNHNLTNQTVSHVWGVGEIITEICTNLYTRKTPFSEQNYDV